ncbi:hypothetical protein FHL15_011404 [Xylaria flabelliformis]|uniref:Uncharacterized protein n=1 Tax=Xylaria flabelliformis TaxID=2512241 RepID=A0A553HID5_9PEZI|nr:hypothetical protein FHL15_011404 [Xylaria flabelliformis]
MTSNPLLEIADPAQNESGTGRPREWLPWYRSSTPPGWKSRGEPEGISSEPTNFGDAQALEKIEKLVNDTWQKKFNEQPYSSFYMISWLMRQAGVTGEELWQKPRALSKSLVSEEQLDKSNLNALTYGCGRCTTFTIQVAEALEDGQDVGAIKGLPRLQWEYHDVSRHRLARCKNTGLVIHSSSPRGFLTVPPDGETIEVDGEYPRSEKLSYNNDGISKLKQLQKAEVIALKSSTGWITKAKGLTVCLNELAADKDLKPLCFFRHAVDEPSGIVTVYYGMIVFVLKKKQLQLRRSRDDVVPVTFYWDPNDPDKEDTVVFNYEEHESSLGPNYHTILADFITRNAGPSGAEQWAISAAKFNVFWRSACNLWGLPRVTRFARFLTAIEADRHGQSGVRIFQDCYSATRTHQDLDGNGPFE